MLTKTAINNRLRALSAINDNMEVIVVKILGVKLEDKFYDFVENNFDVEYGKVVEVVDTFGDKTSFTPLARTTAPAWTLVAFLESLDAPARNPSWEPEVFQMDKSTLPTGYESTVKANEAKGYAFAKYEDGVLTFIKGESGKRAFSFSHDDYEHECVITYYNLLNIDGEKVGELKEIVY